MSVHLENAALIFLLFFFFNLNLKKQTETHASVSAAAALLLLRCCCFAAAPPEAQQQRRCRAFQVYVHRSAVLQTLCKCCSKLKAPRPSFEGNGGLKSVAINKKKKKKEEKWCLKDGKRGDRSSSTAGVYVQTAARSSRTPDRSTAAASQ